MINKQTQSFALIQLRNQSNCVLHAVCLGCRLWRVKASLCAWARLCVLQLGLTHHTVLMHHCLVALPIDSCLMGPSSSLILIESLFI